MNRRTIVGLSSLTAFGLAMLPESGFAQQPDPTGVDSAIEQSHAALAAILKGDPNLYKALFSEQDDVTLGNPFGPYVSGRKKSSKH